MASASEDPIFIPSDEESDADDVVLIKEEIEVDSDDVIFLSESKPPTGSGTNNSGNEASSGKDNKATDDAALNLSTKTSLTALASQLNLEDTGSDANNSMDTCISTLPNYYLGPLDLSSKSDATGPSTGAKAVSNEVVDILDTELFKSWLFDTDLSPMDSVSQNTNTLNTPISDTKPRLGQGPKSSTDIPCDNVPQLNNVKLTASENVSSSVTSTSDQGSDPSKCDSLPDLCKTFNIESILGAPTHSTANTVTTSTQPDGNVFTRGTTDQQIANSVIKPLDPQAVLANAISRNDSSSVVSSSDSTADINSSQVFLKSSDPMWSSKDINLVNNVKTSVAGSHREAGAIESLLSLSGNVPCDQTGLQTTAQTGSILLQPSSNLTFNQAYNQSGFKTVAQNDTNSHNASTCITQSGNSMYSQSGFQTISQIDLLMQNTSGNQSSTSSSLGSNFNQGLPGGSRVPVISGPLKPTHLSNQSAFRCINSFGDTQTSANPLKRSLSSSDQTYMYNPLTLPKSQKESYLRSFSTSSLSSWSDKQRLLSSSVVDQGTSDAGLSSDGGPHQLPPKKQRRCFREGITCTNCEINISGEKSSKCPVGHTTCAKCLEERVKKVITGKAKESIRCLNASCDSFYPMSELRLCLPSMVVEILEDKMGQDYFDYFTGMILKNAMDVTNSDATLGEIGDDESSEMSAFEMVPKSGPKKPVETDPELPEHWEPMNEKSAYEMFTLDVNSDEYNQILPLFFSSMICQKVEVVKIQRIQNPILWKYYSVKKKEMLLENEGFGAVNEQQLYHGTEASVVDAICRKGFDWRVCGKNGTMYGQGTYFAVNASYSHQYTDLKTSRHSRHTTMFSHSAMNIPLTTIPLQPVVYKQNFQSNSGLLQMNAAMNLSNSSNPHMNRLTKVQFLSNSPSKIKICPKPVNIRTMSGLPTWPLEEFIESKKHPTQMFVARVLVGKYSGGSSKLRKPPPLDPKSDPFGKCYDSCVDDIHVPKLFVIFDSAQAYPEYLIEYTYE